MSLLAPRVRRRIPPRMTDRVGIHDALVIVRVVRDARGTAAKFSGANPLNGS